MNGKRKIILGFVVILGISAIAYFVKRKMGSNSTSGVASREEILEKAREAKALKKLVAEMEATGEEVKNVLSN